MKKKIAIIIERATVELGGAERSVFELAEALGEIGPGVDILAAKGETDAENVQGASEAIIADNLKEQISIKRADKQLLSVYESVFQKKDQK